MKKWINQLFVLFLGGMVLVSCNKETDEPPVSGIDYSNGVFVINEGIFNSTSGTISYFNKNGTGLTHKLFQQANLLTPLGDVVQSMNVINERGYIIVNNSNRVEVVSIKTFQSVGSIENVASPRYIIEASDGKAYISSWSDNILILSTNNHEFAGQISVGTGPEKMLNVNGKVWVLNQGGFSIDSTISVIDSGSDQVIQTIQIYPKPTGIQKDINGIIWVMCSGSGWNGWPDSTDTKGHLICLDPVDYSILKDFEFPTTSEHPEKLVINSAGDALFYNYPGGIYKHDIDSDSLDLEPFVARNDIFYGLGLDREDNVLYGSDAMGFTQNGMVYRYDAVNGTVIDSLTVGIGPGEFYFGQVD
jgi:streptogramin lyase